MRNILEKLMSLGYKVVLSEEVGVPVVRLYKGDEFGAGNLVSTCRLTPGTFRETIEETLNSMLLDLERK